MTPEQMLPRGVSTTFGDISWPRARFNLDTPAVGTLYLKEQTVNRLEHIRDNAVMRTGQRPAR